MPILPDGHTLIYEVPVVEGQVNIPVYCSGAALAMKYDSTIHVVLFLDQPTVGGGSERVANLRIIMDANGWAQTMRVIERATEGGS